MKRAIIAAFLLLGISLSYAQDPAGVPMMNFNAMEKKLKKSNEDIVDAKAKLKDKTWFSRGELLLDAHDVNTENLRIGMTPTEAKLFLGEPSEVRTSEQEGVVTEEHVYERITLVYQNGALKDWTETKVLHPDPLPEALKAFNEAAKLDEKGKLDKKIKENLDRLKTQAEADAIRHFSRDEYDKALEKFELIQEVSKAPVYNGMIDSVIIYNSALAARNYGDHERAAYYFEKAADISYGGVVTYFLLKNEYVELNDSLKALDALERGYALYPDSTLIIFELINYHLSSGNSEEGMKYLQKAEQLAGDNPSIYFAKGTLFEKLGDDEKALEAYEESLKIDPEFFNSWFNIGALYFNAAVEMYEAANAIEDLDEYNKAKAAADEELKKSIEPLEKAHSLNTTDKSCLETLKTIYYRLQMTEEMEDVQAKLDAL
jgi:tetratricopeptide (TPR) repeat protein